jgi:Fe-S cluster assembly ATP-binding protein
MLKISELHAQIDDAKILKGVNLEIIPGKVHILMGPNGSGKSTLSKVIAGHPAYEVTQGNITLDNEDITEFEPDQRAKAGVFLAFQYPVEVPGVNYSNFLRLAYNSSREKQDQLPVFKFRNLLKQKATLLDLGEDLLDRNLNEGLSGGEKKKAEILQLAVLEPKYAILDETDSGLDLDALKVVFSGIKKLIETQNQMGVLIITHYQRIFEYITPDFVHIMSNGQIKQTGGMELVAKIEKEGYKS